MDIKSGIFCDPVEFLELFIEKTKTRALFDVQKIQIIVISELRTKLKITSYLTKVNTL